MTYTIKDIHYLQSKTNFLSKDKNGREVNIYTLNNVIFTGSDLYYPNPLIYSEITDEVYSPINEQVMSLKNIKSKQNIEFNNQHATRKEDKPCFFFVYNTDNYYHFIYDSLPYLISYLHLRKTITGLKLLMNYPNRGITTQYKFVSELLSLLNINSEDIKIIQDDIYYKYVYVSDSYTHGIDSNLPPRNEIYDLYNSIVYKIRQTNNTLSNINNIYVSRRSWMHGDLSNIGTNYTTRRRLINEDELVQYLLSKKYQEVFTETLSTIEKILLFADARNVVGAIGGGLCNVLYSNKTCNLISLNSPGFLDINKRFEYAFVPVNYIPFNDTYHENNNEFKLFMRVSVNDIVGEIIDITGSNITVAYTKAVVAGWNNSMQYDTITTHKQNIKKIDSGLNSPWCVDINQFKNILLC